MQVLQKPLLLGHRGTRLYAPENTYEAFDLALAHGCDGFEFDVRLTADAGAVVCHDQRAGSLEVAQATSIQLQELPQLRSVVERYGGKAFLDIELKVRGLEEAVTPLVQRLPAGSYVVSSFLPEVIRKLKRRGSRVVTGLLCEHRRQVTAVADSEADWLIAERRVVSEQLVVETHISGRKLAVWTVNDAAAMQRFAGWGVDGIISDDTQLMVKTLRGSGDLSG
jgi:glycerophosphoryl diester phosphodiesterase